MDEVKNLTRQDKWPEPLITDPTLIVEILKEGDKILNVSINDPKIYISVRKANEEVVVYSVTRDKNGQPKLEKYPAITITFGDGTVKATGKDSNGNEVYSLTA